MKLIVFGGTGKTGAAVLKLSTEDPDLDVTVYVRSPRKIPSDVRRKVRVIVGDAFHSDAVENALAGHEAVISCLGVGHYIGETHVASKGVENIINGMRKHHVEKLAVVGVAFLLPGYSTPFILKNPTADHERALKVIRKAKDIKWTIAMAPGITNAPSAGYKTAINKLSGRRTVNTQDLAGWLINCVKNDENMNEYTHQLVGLSSSISTTNWFCYTAPGRAVIMLGALLVLTVIYYCL